MEPCPIVPRGGAAPPPRIGPDGTEDALALALAYYAAFSALDR